MSRISLISLAQMTREQKAQYDRFPSNLTRGLLLLDQRLAGALPNLANALRASSLDAKIREAVILRVAALHHSAYERMQHFDQARHVGWSDREIDAIESSLPDIESPVVRTSRANIDLDGGTRPKLAALFRQAYASRDRWLGTSYCPWLLTHAAPGSPRSG
jgi:alkylhydroperoxidase family enzyme